MLNKRSLIKKIHLHIWLHKIMYLGFFWAFVLGSYYWEIK
jgi:hypothetical protein